MKKACIGTIYLPLVLGLFIIIALITAKDALCFECHRIEIRNATATTVLINPDLPYDYIDVPWRTPKPTEYAIFTCQVRDPKQNDNRTCDFRRATVFKCELDGHACRDPQQVEMSYDSCVFWLTSDFMGRYQLIPK